MSTPGARKPREKCGRPLPPADIPRELASRPPGKTKMFSLKKSGRREPIRRKTCPVKEESFLRSLLELSGRRRYLITTLQ